MCNTTTKHCTRLLLLLSTCSILHLSNVYFLLSSRPSIIRYQAFFFHFVCLNVLSSCYILCSCIILTTFFYFTRVPFQINFILFSEVLLASLYPTYSLEWLFSFCSEPDILSFSSWSFIFRTHLCFAVNNCNLKQFSSQHQVISSITIVRTFDRSFRFLLQFCIRRCFFVSLI